MSDLKISQLATESPLSGAELVEVVTGGINKKTTTQDISNFGLRLTRTVTGTDAITQADDNALIIFNSATPFNFTIDQLTTNSKASFINIGAGAVTFVAGAGVTITGETTLAAAADPSFPTAILFYLSATGPVLVTGASGSVSDGDKGDVTVSSSGSVWTIDNGVVTASKLAAEVDPIGVQDIWISAASMWARLTGGCSQLTTTEMTTSLFNIQTLDFDQTTQEFAQFQLVMPRKYNNATVTFRPYWTATAGSGTVQWGLSAGSYRNDDALTVAFGTAQTSDDTLIATNDLHIGPESSAITLAGTLADENFIGFQISRNTANDNLNADAKLLGISLRITVDFAKDA